MEKNILGIQTLAALLTVTNPSNGLKFNVRLVKQGETYGVNGCLTHDKPDPLVEFYDDRYKSDGFTTIGQFVSRYYRSTLLERPRNYGLNLDGGVGDWSIDAAPMELVLRKLEGLDPIDSNTDVATVIKRMDTALPDYKPAAWAEGEPPVEFFLDISWNQDDWNHPKFGRGGWTIRVSLATPDDEMGSHAVVFFNRENGDHEEPVEEAKITCLNDIDDFFEHVQAKYLS